MNTRTQSIIHRLQNINEGEPWFGKAMFKILDEVDSSKVDRRPGKDGHSMLDLIYHMNTWAFFTQKRIERDDAHDMKYFEKLDWRSIDPNIHSWEKGLNEFKSIQQSIILLLQSKDDAFLEEIVDFRKYNFRFLVHGMIEHNIYHSGQIAMLNKMFD
jgi:hypothetical protein